MAEEVKEVKATEEKAAEPKVVYEYTVRRYDNGLYDFEGAVLPGTDTPSIDKYHVATDIVELGRKLDHQLLVEEAEQRAVQRVFAEVQAAQEAQAKAEADPTKAQ